MTREQALDEPFDWLVLLAQVASEERAADALYQLQAVLGAVAPGSLKDGDKVYRQIVKSLEKQAGV